MTKTGADIELWFDFASTYSYPAVMRIEQRAAARGLGCRLQPVVIGPIFADLGWDTSPFNLQPQKGRYMWRDLERICAVEDLAFERPVPFPQNSVKAARICLLARRGGWDLAFARALFHAQFAECANIANPRVLDGAIQLAEQDPEEVFAAIEAPDEKPALRAQVERARELDIFGVPTFMVGGEMFWGFDRMHMALDWAAKRKTGDKSP